MASFTHPHHHLSFTNGAGRGQLPWNRYNYNRSQPNPNMVYYNSDQKENKGPHVMSPHPSQAGLYHSGAEEQSRLFALHQRAEYERAEKARMEASSAGVRNPNTRLENHRPQVISNRQELNRQHNNEVELERQKKQAWIQAGHNRQLMFQQQRTSDSHQLPKQQQHNPMRLQYQQPSEHQQKIQALSASRQARRGPGVQTQNNLPPVEIRIIAATPRPSPSGTPGRNPLRPSTSACPEVEMTDAFDEDADEDKATVEPIEDCMMMDM